VILVRIRPSCDEATRKDNAVMVRKMRLGHPKQGILARARRTDDEHDRARAESQSRRIGFFFGHIRHDDFILPGRASRSGVRLSLE
jgi:hypothetical protein